MQLNTPPTRLVRALSTVALACSTAASAQAQECYSLQQSFPASITSSISSSGQLVVLSNVGGAGNTIQLHSFNSASQLYVADPIVGTLPATTANNSVWNLDIVDNFVIAGAAGQTGAPGNAYVTARTPTGYTSPLSLRPLAAAGVAPAPITSNFGKDVALVALSGSIFAFVSDPEFQGPGAVFVFNVTAGSYVTSIIPPGGGDIGFSIDAVETSIAGSDPDPVLLMVGAPTTDLFHPLELRFGSAFDRATSVL